MEETEKGKSVMKECPRCEELEAEIEKRRSEYETLEAKFKEIEAEKKEIEAARNAIENELNSLREAGNRVNGGGGGEWVVGPNVEWHFDWGEGHNGDEIVEEGGGHDGHAVADWGEEHERVPRFVNLEIEEEGGFEEEEEDVVQLSVDKTIQHCQKRSAELQVEFLKRKMRKKFNGLVPRRRNEVGAPVQARRRNEILVGEGSGEAPDNDSASKYIKGEEESFNVETEGEYETPRNDSASKNIKGEEEGFYIESKGEYGGRVRKHLAVEEGHQSPGKKMAPSTPSFAKTSVILIDVCDSDEEPNVAYVQVSEGTMVDQKEMISKGSTQRLLLHNSYEENMVDCKNSVPFASTPKRKRASNIVTSDTENDVEDDNIPICEVEKMHLPEIIPDQACSELNDCSITSTPSGDDNISNLASPPKRRLVRLRKFAEKIDAAKIWSGDTNETKCPQGIPTAEDVEDYVSETTGSDSEGKSLNGFIVESSEHSDGVDASIDVLDESDDNVDFEGILSRLKRSKNKKFEWEFEADMLAAFGKDTELCMKAVCAVYRQQTNEEKISKGSLVYNLRGFSKIDARRATTLAEFLTDGDPLGDLKKSVNELQEYDPEAIETCRRLATRYSKQLFEIYKNKEDALFLPA